MRYLGLDLGSKTLGISISDRTNTIASIYKTIKHNNDYRYLLNELKKIVDEENITKLILGFPKNMNNSVGERGNQTLRFKEMLEKELGLTVKLIDERLTSVISNNLLIEADISRKKRKTKVDNMAAVIILESYLDRKERYNG